MVVKVTNLLLEEEKAGKHREKGKDCFQFPCTDQSFKDMAMDSGNSSSIQSSSGGDEDFDSRSESISAFFNPSNTIANVSNLHPLTTQNHHRQPVFDPLSNYLDTFSRSPTPLNMNSLLNLDAVWAARGQQPETNCTNINRVIGSNSNPFPPTTTTTKSISSNTAVSNQLPHGSDHTGQVPVPTDNPNPARNPKKRSRASRRAPTTVLTTDTSNFRAMVQEFTGIPSPPFSGSSFGKTRIETRMDLFGTSSSMRSPLSSPSVPSYLLRPLAHKPVFTSLPLGTSSSFSSTSTTTLADVVSSSATAATNPSTDDSSNNNTYQLLGDLGLLKQQQNLLNMNNPNLSNFPSLLQTTTPKYPLPNLPSFASKPQELATTESLSKMGWLGEFGMSHGHVNNIQQQGGQPDLVSSDVLSLKSNNDPPSNGCKLNYAGSSLSEFHVEKVPENVASRGEGMVDSWIRSMD